MDSALYIENKYTATYHRIITRARQRTITGYTETHHVVPRCLGGNNSPANLVQLTLKEHRICHKLLVKMVPFKSKKQRKALIVAINSFKNCPRG